MEINYNSVKQFTASIKNKLSKFKYRENSIIIIILLLLGTPLSAFAAIEYYQRTFIPFYSKKGELRIAIRQFLTDKQIFFLLVNPYNFQTSVAKADQLYVRNPATDSKKLPGYFDWKEIQKTPYVKNLLYFTNPPKDLSNAGLTHSMSPHKGFFLTPHKGFFLTVDMCPSIKPFEKNFYLQLVSLGKTKKTPFPVAISMTGLWMLSHQQEFNWLLQMEKEHKLSITWVNHSFSHLYFKDLPLKENFLQFFQTNLESEILTTEILLLEKKQLPSVFIRFPGLIADKSVMQAMQRYGLIPLGSNAWLARNQKPENGSIILVHGNGNEPIGIEDVMLYLKDPHTIWLPIQEALK